MRCVCVVCVSVFVEDGVIIVKMCSVLRMSSHLWQMLRFRVQTLNRVVEDA